MQKSGLSQEISPEGQNIQDYLDVLEKHRLECEQKGLYEEAEIARVRIEQLRQHEEQSRREELKAQQLGERVGVDRAHMKELQEFNDIWDTKVKDFEMYVANLQKTLAQRHKEEHDAHLQSLREHTPPKTPKWSRELLNLRKIQETLAKQKKYAEAEKTKIQADRKEEQELSLWKDTRHAKIGALEEQFLHRQQLEMSGLLKRIQSGREEQKQARKSELERLVQRYHNVKTQLESQQKVIQQRVEKYPSTSAPARPASRPASAGGVGAISPVHSQVPIPSNSSLVR